MFLNDMRSSPSVTADSANSSAADWVCPYPIARSPNVPSACCAAAVDIPRAEDIALATPLAVVAMFENVVLKRFAVSSASAAASEAALMPSVRR